MKRYKFYITKDISKEAISAVNAMNYNDAVVYFANVKGMSVEKFNEIFTVDEQQ